MEYLYIVTLIPCMGHGPNVRQYVFAKSSTKAIKICMDYNCKTETQMQKATAEKIVQRCSIL